MYDRESEAAAETGARQTQRRQEKDAPGAAPAREPAGQTGQTGQIVNRPHAGAPSQMPAGRSLLRLQRSHGNRYVQRFLMLACAAEGEARLTPEVEESIHRSRGGGHALDENVRGRMESAIGADFSGVRVHTGAQADRLSRAVNARAFTVGQDVYFREGAYQPGSSNGRELLAHELTHVVQQSGGHGAGGHQAGGVQRQLTVSQPGDKYEQEADRVAQAVIHQEQSAPSMSDAAPSVQRQIEEDKEKKKEESVQTKAEPGSLQRQAEDETNDEGMSA
jgi:Domain of unknown function (DUF4157)